MTFSPTRVLLCLFSACCFSAGAQSVADSVVFEKKIALLSPEQKIIRLDSVADKLVSAHPVAALGYVQRAMQLGSENDFTQYKPKQLIILARIHKKIGDLDKAEDNINEAIGVLSATGDSTVMMDAYNILGGIFYTRGDFTKALNCYVTAQRIAVKKKDELAEAMYTLNIGNIYLAQQNPAKALESYTDARSFYEKNGQKLNAALALDNMGMALQVMKRDDEALKDHLLAIDDIRQSGDSSSLCEAYNTLAVFYLDHGKTKEALQYLAMALRNARSSNYVLGEIESLQNTSDAYILVRDYARADSVAHITLSLVRNSGMKDVELNVYRLLSEIADSAGRKDSALFYFRRYVNLRDTVFSEEKAKMVADMSAKYDADKKDNQIATLNEDKKRELHQLYLLGSGLIVVILFSIVVVRVNGARRKANRKLAEQNKIIAEKNKDITDSITYARRIQQAAMPDERLLSENVHDYFILNKPRDIVSGDFFWFAKKEDRFYIAVADCTGHGVPGALVSVVGINMLNRITEMQGSFSPSEILDRLHELVIASLNKDKSVRETNDGMDIGLLCIDKKKNRLFFSGAGRPLCYSGKDGFHVIRGDRFSVAGEKSTSESPFVTHEIPLLPGMKFYLFSDGYADQFGEQTGKKFLSKKLHQLLDETALLSMHEQCGKLDEEFEMWKGKADQVDDVLVIGIRV